MRGLLILLVILLAGCTSKCDQIERDLRLYGDQSPEGKRAAYQIVEACRR